MASTTVRETPPDPNAPSPEDVAIREHARKIAASLPRPTPEQLAAVKAVIQSQAKT